MQVSFLVQLEDAGVHDCAALHAAAEPVVRRHKVTPT
jgi:hypothetical protein